MKCSPQDGTILGRGSSASPFQFAFIMECGGPDGRSTRRKAETVQDLANRFVIGQRQEYASGQRIEADSGHLSVWGAVTAG